jgi:hypothetical protein
MANRPQTNGLDAEAVKHFISALDGHFAELASEKGSYMARCRSIREAMQTVYEDAKSAGVRRKSLAVYMKNKLALAKIDERIAELEDDDRENHDLLVDAVPIQGLEGLPLGDATFVREQAAVERKRRAKGERLDGLGGKPDGDPQPAA